MATRGLLPGDLGVSASLEKLRRQFDAFYSYRTVLKESYGRVTSCFHLLEDDGDCDGLKTLFKEGTKAIEGILEKDPIILIGGQLNCGKSSFINLLLNRTVVPVNEHPCTARIVRIKYSQDEYYQLTDATGNGKGPRCPLNRKTLWKEIDIGEGRERRATVDEVVEIGLNSPLLESGLQIIDTPGLSENEALDAVVKQCLDGVLQVLFYVIDGNTAWRNQDANFISNIMTQSPDMKIIYICNKCEEDETAAQYDAPDGDEDGSDNDSEVVASPIPKGTIVYTKLKNSCLLEEREDITCNRYFQISCLRLKRSRSRDYVPDEFTVEYQRLINSLCAILRHFLYHSLRQAVLTLFSIVTKCYDVCSKHERSRPPDLVPVLLEKFEETHLEFVAAVFKYEDQLRNAVAGVLASKTDEVITKSVARISDLGSILERVDKKGFYHILVGLSTLAAEIASDDTVQLTMKTIESDTKAISNKFSQTCEDLGAHGDTLTLLKVFTDAIDKADLSEGLTSFMAHHVQNCILQQMSSNDGERASMNCLSLDTIITLIDPADLSGDTCRKISSEISGLGEALCLLCELVELVNNVKENSAFSKKVRSSFSAENLILASLLSTLQHKEVAILERVGEGSHCQVYKAKRGNMVIAARRTLAAENSEDFREMAKTYAIFRDLSNKDHLNILKPFDVGRDSTGQVLVLVPYIEKNLFQELCDGTMTQCEPEERLSVGLQIINGCMFLKEMGLEAVDLRPNNIRLQNGCPMIDISKGRAVHTPYPPPDNKPPFHFPAECIRHEQKRYPSTQDSFGCAILVWMLACGRFIRPPFANEDGPAGQGPDPKVAILCNIARVRQEFGEIIEQQSCSEESQRGMFPFLPLVKTILENCITDEMERVDVVELHEMLQSQMAVIV